MLGGVIGGDPRVTTALGISTIQAVALGSFIGGFGNALSTWLCWETDANEKFGEVEAENKQLKDRMQILEDRMSRLESNA